MDLFNDTMYESITVPFETCKEFCKINCTEVIRSGFFNQYLWMLFASLFILLIYFIFNYNVVTNQKTRTMLEQKGYNIQRLENNISWILLLGMGFLIMFLITFYFASGDIVMFS